MIRILYDENPVNYKDTLVQSVLNKLYRRNVFNGVSFGGRFGEDCNVMNLIYSKRIKVRVIDDEFYDYYYTSNIGSLSHTVSNEQRLIFLDILTTRIAIYDDQYIKGETIKRYCDLYIGFLNNNDTFHIVSRRKGKYALRYREYVIKLLNEYSGNISIPKKKRIRWYLAYISPKLYRFTLAIRRLKGYC